MRTRPGVLFSALDCRIDMEREERAKYDAMAEKYRGLVHRCLARYGLYEYVRTGKLEQAELLQVGFLGLLVACHKFDASRKVAFSKYASYWIRRAVQMTVFELLDSVYIPDDARFLHKKYLRVREDFYIEHGYYPSDSELSTLAGFKDSDWKIIESVANARRVTCLDQSHTTNGKRILFGDLIGREDVDVEKFENTYRHDEYRQLFHDRLKALLIANSCSSAGQKKYTVFKMYFCWKLTVEEIAELYGCTHQNISLKIRQAKKIIKSDRLLSTWLKFLAN